jgi:hypothetical protein
VHESLKETSPVPLREALGGACAAFGVARNLPREIEAAAGLRRYELLRRAFVVIEPRHAKPRGFADVVVALADDIASRYGGRRFLSAASKLLWARYRDPFLIYDARARLALGTRAGDYHAYAAEWQTRYARHADVVRAACDALGTSRTTAGAASLARRRWFRRRVFDLALWLDGGR